MNKYQIRDLKRSRDKQINKLSKLLKLLVATEWEMITIAQEKNDNISYKAAKTVSEASKNIQLSISQLILTDFSNIEKEKTNKSTPETIRSLKKVVLGKK